MRTPQPYSVRSRGGVGAKSGVTALPTPPTPAPLTPTRRRANTVTGETETETETAMATAAGKTADEHDGSNIAESFRSLSPPPFTPQVCENGSTLSVGVVRVDRGDNDDDYDSDDSDYDASCMWERDNSGVSYGEYGSNVRIVSAVLVRIFQLLLLLMGHLIYLHFHNSLYLFRYRVPLATIAV